MEVFPAASGDVYLLRAGHGPDVVIRDPSPADRRLLGRLADGESIPMSSPEAERLEGLQAAGLLIAAQQPRLRPPDSDRFSRQLPYLAGLGDAGDAMRTLRSAHVLIIGCGGLGTWALAAIASTGVGSFTLVDDDTVALSNLNRQILFGVGDVGACKVDRAAAWLEAFDPSIGVTTHAARVQSAEDVKALLDGVDLLVLAADWPPHELGRWVNQACAESRVPFVTAGQAPPLLRIGPTYVPGETACFACHERWIAEAFPLYIELTEHRRRHGTIDTTLGPPSAVIGALIGLEALHLLIGLPAEVATAGRALLMDMRTLETHWEAVPRDPECPICA